MIDGIVGMLSIERESITRMIRINGVQNKIVGRSACVNIREISVDSRSACRGASTTNGLGGNGADGTCTCMASRDSGIKER